jgi:predicted site-specific integrase-resolvase
MTRPHKTPTAPEPRWLNSQQAADYLGVPISSLRRWVAAGLLNPSKPSGFLRGPSYFRPDELDALMETSRTSALQAQR